MRTAPAVSLLAVAVLGLPAPVMSQDQRSERPRQSVVKALASDVAALPSKDTALILGISAALAIAVHPADRHLTQQTHASNALDRTFEVGESLGGGWAQAGGAVGTLMLGHSIHNTRIRNLGVDLVRAQVVTSLLTQGVKVSVGRRRPDGGRFSFPSGHASTTFSTAAVLHQHFGWKAGIPAYAMASYVALSRLQENRHYASDVIFGAALGIVGGRTVTIGRGSRRWSVSPVVVPGGVGVAVGRVHAR